MRLNVDMIPLGIGLGLGLGLGIWIGIGIGIGLGGPDSTHVQIFLQKSATPKKLIASR